MKACQLFILMFFLSVTTPALSENNQPGHIVKSTVNNILSLLREADLTEKEKREKTYALVEAQIDFDGMCRRILALQWKKTSDEQKQIFKDLFKQLLLDTYWKRIKNYADQEVQYITGMIEGHTFATVDTVIITDKVEIPITYRLELIEDEWKAYDFLIESLSLVTNYRNQYRNIIKLHGIDGLLEHMQTQVEELNHEHQ